MAANNNSGFFPGYTGPDMVVTTDAFSVETMSAITTRELVYVGCYETFQGAP